MVNLKINGIPVEIAEGSTILEAAEKVKIHIPTLCHLEIEGIGYANQEANCRVCLVESSGRMVAACNTLVKEGMDIRTDTLRVIRSRRTNIELLLSNHPKDCLVCKRSGHCELQDLSVENNVREVPFEGERIEFEIDDSSLSLIRDPNKCILCKRCETMCNHVQTVGTLTDVGRGFSTVIGTAYQDPLTRTNCTFCGQCLSVCPTGALYEVSAVDEVYQALNDPEKIVIVQTAPAVRVAIGEEFGMSPGEITTGKMVTGLKRLGFDYVFDTNFAADLTVMEEAHEFIERFKTGENLPILTSCCPSWIKFIEHNFSDMLDIPSSCKSPHEMMGSMIKTYFAEKLGLDSANIVVVSVMPCIAKKYESARPELITSEGFSDVDYVVTTRELASMFRDFALDYPKLEDSDFDDPLGRASGAGTIFGSTGGVLEASLRTAYKMITGEELEDIEFEELKGFEGIKEAEVEILGETIRAAASSSLGNARKLLDRIRAGERDYHLIEIMACPGGCVAGGGQPYSHGDRQIIRLRGQGLHEDDRNSEIRRSHENPDIKMIYEEFLGHPGSERAHELLHTDYVIREKF